jgi:hypothetical protein
VNSKNNMKVENANVLSESHNVLNRFEAKADSNAYVIVLLHVGFPWCHDLCTL